jgi:hypothetical protein
VVVCESVRDCESFDRGWDFNVILVDKKRTTMTNAEFNELFRVWIRKFTVRVFRLFETFLRVRRVGIFLFS